MDGLDGIASPRPIDLVPHAVYTGARLLDSGAATGPAYRTNNEPNAGVDLCAGRGHARHVRRRVRR